MTLFDEITTEIMAYIGVSPGIVVSLSLGVKSDSSARENARQRHAGCKDE